MIARLIFLTILVIICLSCSRGLQVGSTEKNKCILDKEKNRIYGSDLSAKVFGSELEYYLPRVIENLAFNCKIINTNYNEPLHSYFEEDTINGGIRVVSNPNVKSKMRAAFTIEGCADTIWAKKRMAEHLMQKYKLTRIDSFFYNDIFTYSLHQDSLHLLKTHDDPNIFLGMKNIGWDRHCMGCTVAASIGWILDEQGYSQNGIKRFELLNDKNYPDQDFLENTQLHFIYNYKKYREIDTDNLAKELRNDFGILLTHEKTDTVKMGYYILDE